MKTRFPEVRPGWGFYIYKGAATVKKSTMGDCHVIALFKNTRLMIHTDLSVKAMEDMKAKLLLENKHGKEEDKLVRIYSGNSNPASDLEHVIRSYKELKREAWAVKAKIVTYFEEQTSVIELVRSIKGGYYDNFEISSILMGRDPSLVIRCLIGELESKIRRLEKLETEK